MFSMFSEMSEFIGGCTESPMLEMTAEESEAFDNAPEADYSSLDIEESFSQMALENERNFNNIMMSTMVQEATYFMEHGEEMVYEGEALKNFWQKIKDFFKKAWEKIKSIFNKVVAWISSVIRSDKAYLDKYASKIKEVDGEKINVKGFKAYDTIDKTTAKETIVLMGQIVNIVQTNMNLELGAKKNYDRNNFTKDTKKEDAKRKFWAKLSEKFGGDTVKNADEFSKVQNKSLEDGQGTIETVNAEAVISIIRDAKMSKTAIKNAYEGAKKCINGLMKLAQGYEQACKLAERDADKPDNKGDKKSAAEISGAFSTFAKESITALNILYKSTVKRINKSYSTAKAIARAAVNLKKEDKKDDSTNESFSNWSDTFLV